MQDPGADDRDVREAVRRSCERFVRRAVTEERREILDQVQERDRGSRVGELLGDPGSRPTGGQERVVRPGGDRRSRIAGVNELEVQFASVAEPARP